MKTKVLGLLITVLIAGCEDGKFVPTQASREKAKRQKFERLDAREKLFKECLQLAAQIRRQADDDVSDIVDSCDSSAAYMTINR